MTRFFRKATYLFTLFTLACGGSSASKGNVEGDASGKTNDDMATTPVAPTIEPNRMLSCLAGAMMVALGCGDGGAEAGLTSTPDGGALASDTRLPDAGTSQMMDAQASKDSTMPNDTTLATTPTPTDGGSDGSVRADAQPMSADAQPPLGVPNVMEIVKKLKFVPARVIFITLNRQIMVTNRNVTLPPGLPPPRNSFMSSTCRRDDLGVYEWVPSGVRKGWRYAAPSNGGFFEPSTVLTKAEIEKLGLTDMDVVDKGPNGQIAYPSAPRFTALSIDEWLSAQPDPEAALEALKPEALCY